ncbi:MAG: aminoacyl-histidine dipeptidase [Bacteroidales bacterium]|nr:aminoacyl-histidine dipeptidase [Bacteroidales bacterium]
MENFIFKGVEPERVWYYFYEISKIPRPSKKEDKIIAYLEEFGKKHELETIKDKVGNIVIRKPATAGFENKPWVCLQSHVDMVCEKNPDSNHDFEKDPLQLKIVDQWVMATGTTLGADNGIGVAMSLAILEDKSLQHGPIECLFTVDEETGLTGAFALDPSLLKSKILINLDSEDEGVIFIGCAGGRDTTGKTKISYTSIPAGLAAFEITIGGLKGGHSGDDINKGRANANKLLARILAAINESTTMYLCHIDGGNLRNAIPRDAKAIIAFPPTEKENIVSIINTYQHYFANEYKVTDPEVKVSLSEVSLPDKALESSLKDTIIRLLLGLPHGVLAYSQDIPDFVETSTNLASIKIKEDEIVIATSQRSSLESAKLFANQMVASVFALAQFSYTHSDGYPGWNPNPNSPLLKKAVEIYEELYQQKANVRAIHAGLECGLFSEKIPGMDMISIGPTMRGVHSPEEKLLIPTVERVYKWVQEILKRI